jgi:hypothetical protein
MYSKLFLVSGGVLLLLIAAAGALCWAMGFAFWSKLLMHGGTVFFDRSSKIPLPGRLLGIVVLIAPLICFVCGVWLVRSAFEKDDDCNT